MNEDNLLPAIAGDHVARGMLQLPDAATATVETAEVTVDAGHAGRVTITYARHHYKRGKFSSWSWRPVSARRAA